MKRKRATVPLWLRIARGYLQLTNPIAHVARGAIKRLDEKTLFADVAGSRRLCIDVGAGTSPYRQQLIDHLRIDRYIPMDIATSDSTAIVGDATRMPFATGCAQFVTSFDSLQHIHNYRGVLDEIARILAPGGAVLLTFPFMYCECDVQDHHRWTLQGMEFDLRAHGFEIFSISPRGGRFFTAASAMSWAIQHMIPGQRRKWRATKTLADIFRAAVVQCLTLPTTLLQWAMLPIDRLLPNNGCYMGGIAVAVKAQSRSHS